jgi:MFS family permease
MASQPELNVINDTDDVHYCEIHPDRETELRCNKCGRYMCAQCAVSTPVGYRCQQCVRQLEDKFYTAGNNDNVLIFGAVAVLTGIGGAVVSGINLWLILTIFASIIVGGAIAEVARRLVQKRRGRNFATIAAAGAVVGGLIGALIPLALRIGGIPPMEYIIPILTNNLSMLIFVGVVAAVVYGRFKM